MEGIVSEGIVSEKLESHFAVFWQEGDSGNDYGSGNGYFDQLFRSK